MQHISPLVFSSVTLIDPAITAVLAWCFGIEGLPAWYAWVGGIIVMVGVGLISYGERGKAADIISSAASDMIIGEQPGAAVSPFFGGGNSEESAALSSYSIATTNAATAFTCACAPNASDCLSLNLAVDKTSPCVEKGIIDPNSF
jgi:hypothetical protein